MYHFPNHQIYHQNTYQQQCPVYVEHTKHSAVSGVPHHNQYQVLHHSLPSIEPESIETQPSTLTLLSNTKKKSKVSNKGCVDTSSFSIEERLVAAVWVHEKKNTKSSMSQIKHNFRQRFGREPPAKNTLLVWERKLFSTGSVHDAPRPGRPVNRRNRVDEVAASVKSAPALSLRARAQALRVPRTTLRTILRNDLLHATNKTKDTTQNTDAGKQPAKRSTKSSALSRGEPQMEAAGGCVNVVSSIPRDSYMGS